MVNSDQVGYIKGRFIGEVVRLIHDVYFFTEKQCIPGAALYIDFEKAFDCISWDYMHQVLHKFGFGPEFRRWIKVIYTDVQSAIINNAWMSSFFTLTRGVRQGCPLSALLFVMCVEILACKVRQSPDIEGVPLPCKNLNRNVAKIAQLADDTTLFVKDEGSILKALETLSDFEKVSGLKVNVNKSEAVWLGEKKGCTDEIGGLKWSHQPVKALGVWFGYNQKRCEQLNWDSKVAKFENILCSWGKRNLTLYGKIVIVNTLGLSQLNYLASMITVPDIVIQKIDKLIYEFVTKGLEKMSRKVLIGKKYYWRM